MATSVTQSLFGMTPQMIQAQREADLQAQALRFAQLTPMQQAQAGLFTAGSQLGTGIAGALGYEDPEMAQARARQGLLGGVDMSDPQMLREAARMADPVTAQMLTSRALELEKGLADIGAAEALANQRNREARINYGADLEAESAAMFDKSFANLTPDERRSVVQKVDNKELQKRTAGASRTSVTVTPTIKQAGDIIGLVKGYEDLTKPEREMLRSAQTSKELINNAASSNNSQAWEAARTQIAKAVGEGKLSNEDIRRTGVDPRLVQGALDWVNKKIEGVPNQSIMQQLYTVASILERTSVDRINQSAQRTRSAARIADVPESEMDVMFPLIPTDRSPRRQGAGSAQTSRGTKYQIIED
jgi:hypothetical protein